MIEIITLNGYFNYGNRLQLFALSSVLKKLNETPVVYWPKNKKTIIKNIIKYSPLLRKYEKEKKLRKFTQLYTPKTTNKHICKFSVVGSDQVWNPDYVRDNPYLLLGGSRISYAASIGRESLTNDQKKTFREALKHYSSISVREQSAKRMLQPLTNKKIEVVLDPTLLLDREEYAKLEKRPRDITEGQKYILCYILGGHESIDVINKYAHDNNCKVVLFSDKKDSKYGVEEFLYLIHHAQLICTDSFHACVFSVIFEKPFVAFKRTGEADYMYTRLKNLIDTFGLKNREFNGVEITEYNDKIDYSKAKVILEKEKKKSLYYLKKALEAEDE